jgi:hypothetical protein
MTRLAYRDAVGSDEPWNAKIEHRVVIGTKHEHVCVRVEATVTASQRSDVVNLNVVTTGRRLYAKATYLTLEVIKRLQ